MAKINPIEIAQAGQNITVGDDLRTSFSATQHGDHFDISISDVHAAELLTIHPDASFSSTDFVTVDADAASTHLHNSLKDLQKLHIDQVSLAGGAEDIHGLGGNTIDLGAGSLHDAVSAGLPVFNSGEITLDTSVASLDGLSSSDVSALSAAHIDEVYVDLANSGDINAAFTNGPIDSIASAANVFNGVDGHPEFEINVGNTVDHTGALVAGQSTVHISDVNAATLLGDGLSFAEHNHVTVDADAASTHLHNSLKDLQKLHIDQVSLGDHQAIIVDTHATGELSRDLIGTLSASLPNFDHWGDVTVDLQNSTNHSSHVLNAIVNQGSAPDLASFSDNLVNHGVDHLAIHDAIDLGLGNSDWMNLSSISQIHLTHSPSVNGLNFTLDMSGSSDGAAISFDNAISHETFDGIDFSGIATDTGFDSLISALQESGVHEFRIETGKVEITDHLASALDESGMLSALPSADLTLDASSEVKGAGDDAYVHLATSANSLATMGVDQVDIGSAKKVYLDLHDLGLPANDPAAMQDIHALLQSLDPANGAKFIGSSTDNPTVILGMSTDMLHMISSEGGLSNDDISHLKNMGVTEIAVQPDAFDKLGTAETDAAKLFANNLHSNVTVSIIGESSEHHDIFDPNKLHVPK